MFKHNVTYVDFNGNKRSEDIYFHLSLPEVTRLQAEIGKDIEVYIKELVDNQNVDELLKFMERIMLSAYGQKTSDGKSFRKSAQLREDFEYSNAYAEIFEQMMTDTDLARRFGENVSDNSKTRKNQIAPQVVNQPRQQS